ncbi:hypothetical protein MKW98_026137 [Papaver atlanticum]|uniref:Uncharacterized protein n=1 Tax=Papaver atlanticum TaxID=357466 RepID=A0AAD4RY55_9MAGN|nr:hypothetical protein MKW98_026137 [Papaver atlanticum]
MEYWDRQETAAGDIERLDQPETAATAEDMSHFKKREKKTTCLKDCVKWGRKSILFFVHGISLVIKSEREMLEVTIENFERNRFYGMAQYLGLFCDRVKQEIVDKMAAEILAFFIRPEELARTLCWTGKNHKEKLKKDEQLKLIRAHRANRQRKISKSRRLKVRAYFV